MVSERLGFSVVTLAGPAPSELTLAETVAAAVDDAHIVTDVPSPRHLAALLEHAAVVIGNDSGVLHLAAAVERPIVAIFGPTNDRAWGPYPPNVARHQVVAETLACRPCIHRGFSFGTPQGCPARTCLHLIQPEAVLQAIRRALECGE
jgi:heptosyltransferase-2